MVAFREQHISRSFSSYSALEDSIKLLLENNWIVTVSRIGSSYKLDAERSHIDYEPGRKEMP